jgi:hypothetical protein
MTAGRISTELWWTNQVFSTADIIPPWFNMSVYHLVMNDSPVGVRSSEMFRCPIDMIAIIINIVVTSAKMKWSRHMCQYFVR